MLLFFLAWTIVAARFEATGETEIKRLGYPQIALIWLFDVCYSIAWSGLIVAYALEICPFRLRARGLMIMNFFIQVALTIGNQTNPVALENLPNNWNFWCFYTVRCLSFINTDASKTNIQIGLDRCRARLCLLLLR